MSTCPHCAGHGFVWFVDFGSDGAPSACVHCNLNPPAVTPTNLRNLVVVR